MSHSTVLYDAPGPKARKRSLAISVIGVIAILALLGWAVWRLAQPQVAVNGNITPGMFDLSRWDVLSNGEVWTYIGEGVINTLRAAFVAMVGALVIGVLFSFGRLADSVLIRVPVTILLEFFRGMPVLLMMLFILLVASTGAFWAVVIALAVYNGAIIGEALRAGILSLNKGQREAGLSIGLTRVQTRLMIEFPQAFRQMLPILLAQLVVLLKDTSLGYIVAYPELAATIRNLTNYYGNSYMFTFWVVAITIYLIINLTVSWIGRRVAKATAAKTGGATGNTDQEGVVAPSTDPSGDAAAVEAGSVQALGQK